MFDEKHHQKERKMANHRKCTTITYLCRKQTHQHEKIKAAMDKTMWETTHHNGNDNGLSLIMECFEEMVVCQKAHVANIADWPDNFVAKNKSASVSHLPQLLSSDPLQKLCPKKRMRNERRGNVSFLFVDIELLTKVEDIGQFITDSFEELQLHYNVRKGLKSGLLTCSPSILVKRLLNSIKIFCQRSTALFLHWNCSEIFNDI